MFRPLEPPKPPKTKKASIIDNNTTPAELAPLKSTANTNGGDQYLQIPQKVEGNGNGVLCRSNSVGHTLQKNHQVSKISFVQKCFEILVL